MDENFRNGFEKTAGVVDVYNRLKGKGFKEVGSSLVKSIKKGVKGFKEEVDYRRNPLKAVSENKSIMDAVRKAKSIKRKDL